MSNRGKAVVDDARVKRAVANLLKSLGSSRKRSPCGGRRRHRHGHGDGGHVSVRLVGIDTPESVAPQEERSNLPVTSS